MKSFFVTLVFSFFLFHAQSQTDSIKNNSKIADTANAAKIIVIRETGHIGSAVNLSILVDKINYCKIRNNRYTEFFAEPGTHVFYAKTWDQANVSEKLGLNIPLEAGKTYYLTAHIKPRFMSTDIFLEEVTYNTARPLMEKYKLDACR